MLADELFPVLVHNNSQKYGSVKIFRHREGGKTQHLTFQN